MMSDNSKQRHKHKTSILPVSILGWLFITAASVAQPHYQGSHANSDAKAVDNAIPIESTPALPLTNSPNLKTIIPELAQKQVVFIGEIHTRYDHHLTQLEIIKRLHAIHPDLVIGLEIFQQPFQEHLDDYVRGEIDEDEMLRRTEYYVRWRYDYRLYAPILRFARENNIPLLALNIPTEISRKVSASGVDNLTEAERTQIPEEIDRTDKEYETRLREIFKQHSAGNAEDFDNFVTAQLLWDEGMAQAITDHLTANPDKHMVVIAGRGHLAYGSGIPNRVTRRLPVSTAIVLNSWEEAIRPGLADVLLLPQEQVLPNAGKIGALLDENDAKDKLTIASCVPDSACSKAGLKKGDQILAINEQKITNLADLRVIMWDKQPDEVISLSIRRKHWFSSPEELTLRLTLQ